MEYQFETYKRNYALQVIAIIIIDIIIAYAVLRYFRLLVFIDLNAVISLLFFLIFDFILFEGFIFFRFFEQPATIRMETKENGIAIKEGRCELKDIPYKNIFGLRTVEYWIPLKYSLSFFYFSSTQDMESFDSKKNIVLRALHGLILLLGGGVRYKNFILTKDLAEKIEKDIDSGGKKRLARPVSVALDPSFSNLATDKPTEESQLIVPAPGDGDIKTIKGNTQRSIRKSKRD